MAPGHRHGRHPAAIGSNRHRKGDRHERQGRQAAHRLRRRLVGRPHRPRALERRAWRAGFSVLRDHGRSHRLGRPGAQAPRPGLSGLRHLAGRPHARGAAALHGQRHAHCLEPGLDPPAGRGAARGRTMRRSRLEACPGSRGQRHRSQRQHRGRRAVHHGKRRARGVGGRHTDLGRALRGRRSHCAGAGRGRRHRHHRPRGRPVAVPGADDAPLRLARRRLGAAGAGQRHRPPAGMRRAGHGRLFRRPRLQRLARALEPGLSVCRRRGGRHGRDRQSKRHRRLHRPAHGEGTDVLRGARPGPLHHA